jgi:hypothetical protein
MIDFPSSPSVGQVFTAAGASWRWDGTKWVAYGGGSSGNVGRNLLHNSLFQVAQRGTGPFTTLATYNLDRWATNGNTDTSSITQQPLTDADRAAIGNDAAAVCLQNVFTGNAAAGAYHELQQRIENVRRLASQTITVSFWAKAAAGTPKLGINLTMSTGTGGSPSAPVNALATGNSVTLSTTWARYSTTIALPSLTGLILGTNGDHSTVLRLAFSSGATNNAFFGNIAVQSGTIQLWGIQLETGTVATPLEKPDPADDLAKCQRFYFGTVQVVASGYQSAGAILGTTVLFPTTMRAAPTATFAASGNVNIGTVTPTPLGTFGLYIQGAATATGSTTINGNITASADL